MSTLSREEMGELTIEELVGHANVVYGLGVNTHYERAHIEQMVMEAQSRKPGNDMISVHADEDDREVQPGYIKVRVQPGQFNPKNRPIFIAHNFRPATVPVNVDVVMPAMYENCLRDAVRTDTVQDPNTLKVTTQDNFSYPYSVVERGPECDAATVMEAQKRGITTSALIREREAAAEAERLRQEAARRAAENEAAQQAASQLEA